jgi:hypothetical protein
MHTLDFQAWADWIIRGIIGFVCWYGVRVFQFGVGILKQMKDSIDELNEKMAKIIERSDWHTRELDKLEARLTFLETRKK